MQRGQSSLCSAQSPVLGLLAAHRSSSLVRETSMCHRSRTTRKYNEDLGERRSTLLAIIAQVGKMEALLTCTITSLSVSFVVASSFLAPETRQVISNEASINTNLVTGRNMAGIDKQGQEMGNWDTKQGPRRTRRAYLRLWAHQDFPSTLEIISMEVALPFQVSDCHC